MLEDGTPQGKPSCFNARCPHLGCTVNYKAAEQKYVCPCHDSAFTLDGDRNNDIPPRNMDPLEIEIRNEREVWVKFQNFRAGKEERVPIA
jgi:menaquinol-cytochrome c reductase iron-sulfur subunit